MHSITEEKGLIMQDKKLKKYFDQAGGTVKIAERLQRSRKTVWEWQYIGFPDTEWSGRTRYAEVIAALCRENGYRVFTQDLLGRSK